MCEFAGVEYEDSEKYPCEQYTGFQVASIVVSSLIILVWLIVHFSFVLHLKSLNLVRKVNWWETPYFFIDAQKRHIASVSFSPNTTTITANDWYFFTQLFTSACFVAPLLGFAIVQTAAAPFQWVALGIGILSQVVLVNIAGILEEKREIYSRQGAPEIKRKPDNRQLRFDYI